MKTPETILKEYEIEVACYGPPGGSDDVYWSIELAPALRQVLIERNSLCKVLEEIANSSCCYCMDMARQAVESINRCN